MSTYTVMSGRLMKRSNMRIFLIKMFIGKRLLFIRIIYELYKSHFQDYLERLIILPKKSLFGDYLKLKQYLLRCLSEILLPPETTSNSLFPLGSPHFISLRLSVKLVSFHFIYELNKGLRLKGVMTFGTSLFC